MSKLDRPGIFKGSVLESAASLTKNGYPQAILRLVTTHRYVTDKEELLYYKMEEEGYVDYPDEEITCFAVLFKSKDEFTAETALFNYENLMTATGWDGQSFDALTDGSLNGKHVLFRVEEDTYEGKTSLKVQSLDHVDAPPVRGLKPIDANILKSMNARIKVTRTKPAVAPAKPVAPAKASGKPNPTPAGPSRPQPATAAPAALPIPAVPKASSKKKTSPSKSAKETAWETIQANKKEADDGAVADAWIAACGQFFPDGEPDVNNEMWVNVAETTLATIA